MAQVTVSSKNKTLSSKFHKSEFQKYYCVILDK
jgi:hypothetical protein